MTTVSPPYFERNYATHLGIWKVQLHLTDPMFPLLYIVLIFTLLGEAPLNSIKETLNPPKNKKNTLILITSDPNPRDGEDQRNGRRN